MLWELGMGLGDALSIPVCLHHNSSAHIPGPWSNMGKRAWGAHLPHTATPISPFCAQRLGLGMVVVKDGSRWVSWKQVPGLVGCFFFFLTGRSWRFMKASPSLFNAKALQLVSFDLL